METYVARQDIGKRGATDGVGIQIFVGEHDPLGFPGDP
jgi:hypothetical protein